MTAQPQASIRIDGPQLKAATAPVAGATPAPAMDASGAIAMLQLLLKIEHDARSTKTLQELWFLMANDSRRLLQARQIFVLEETGGAFHMRAASSLAKVDRQSPTILWMERAAAEAAGSPRSTSIGQVAIPDLKAGKDASAASFPFRHMLHIAISAQNGERMALLVAVREQPFGESEMAAAERLAGVFGYTASALGGIRRRRTRSIRRASLGLGAFLTIAALMFVPVPMNVLAGAEVTARSPSVIAAPIEGVIDQIPVDASKPVKAGDVLVRFVDTTARNQLEVSQQEVAVAEAKWRQVSLAAFSDPAARREMSVSANELALKKAERDYAREVLGRTVLRADKDGIAVFADKRELIGRPVQTGQRIMEIADPDAMRIKITVPVDDAMPLKTGAEVKVFLDSDPLNPVPAVVAEASHQAKQQDNGSLAFRVDADVPPEMLSRLRIGHRGTAQIFGERVSLGFYLFRRPISALRQKFGL
jgi:multidrug resistance efflux pump